ncbi:MAG: hypothetical protein V1777_03645 [Candidatus Micrarchaeota archaeon]
MNSNPQKKGQSALEYLMTYGWGLVVVGVVIAALVLINQPSLIANSTTGFNTSLLVKNTLYPKSAYEPLQLIIVNQSGRTLSGVTLAVKVNGASITGTTIVDPQILKPGQQASLFFMPTTPAKWSSGKLQVEIMITAQDQDLFQKASTGQITFQVSPSGPICYSIVLEPSTITQTGGTAAVTLLYDNLSAPVTVTNFDCSGGIAGGASFVCTDGSCSGKTCGNYTAGEEGSHSITATLTYAGGTVTCPATTLTVSTQPRCTASFNPNSIFTTGSTALDITSYNNFTGKPTTASGVVCGDGAGPNGTQPVSCTAVGNGTCSGLSCSGYAQGIYSAPAVTVSLMNGSTPISCWVDNTLTVNTPPVPACNFTAPASGATPYFSGTPLAVPVTVSYSTFSPVPNQSYYSDPNTSTSPKIQCVSGNPGTEVPLTCTSSPCTGTCTYTDGGSKALSAIGLKNSTSGQTALCTGTPTISIGYCGDSQLQTSNEQCDSNSLLNGKDCTTVLGGYTGGTLACKSDCTFDTSGCFSTNLNACGTPLGGWRNNQTYTLLNDVTASSGQACFSFDAVASNVTLNCNNKTIAGDSGAPNGAIDILGNGNTVQNCIINNSPAGTGIYVAGTNNKLSNNTIQNTTTGKSIWVLSGGNNQQQGEQANICPVGTCFETDPLNSSSSRICGDYGGRNCGAPIALPALCAPPAGGWISGQAYTLTGPITDTLSSTCFTINQPNITLDCQGKTITASKTGSVGISITAPAQNVTVKNCTITAGNQGVMIAASNAKVEYNTISVFNTGYTLSVAGVLANCTASLCTGISISHNTFPSTSKNQAVSVRGATGFGVTNSTISNNTIDYEGTTRTYSSIFFDSFVYGNTLSNNSITSDRNYDSAVGSGAIIYIQVSGQNSILDNTINATNSTSPPIGIYTAGGTCANNNFSGNNFCTGYYGAAIYNNCPTPQATNPNRCPTSKCYDTQGTTICVAKNSFSNCKGTPC